MTREELAACGIKLKKVTDEEDGYNTDSSDEETPYSRGDLTLRRAALKGIGKALQEAPGEFVNSFKSLIKNPITTVENWIALLKKIPQLPAAINELFAYLDTLEGNEEMKGEEIGHFIAEQVICFFSPSKMKLLGSLAKAAELQKLGKAARVIAEYSKQSLNGVKLSNKGLKKIGSLLEHKDKPAREVLKLRKGNASAFNIGRSDYWDKPLGEIANLAGAGNKEANTIMKLVKEAKQKAQKYGGK